MPTTRPTTDQVIAEIAELKRIAPLIPPTTMFGDSNEDAIRAEIVALETLWDEDRAYDEYPTTSEGVKDQLDSDMDDEEAASIALANEHDLNAALSAIQWRLGTGTDKPSDGWIHLVKA